MHKRYHVAIIGGGFSGIALAAQLVRRGNSRLAITLLEAGARLGRGLAYDTTVDSHLLNSPADQMSLYSDKPEHFIDWSRRNGEPIPHAGFARRRSYGAYLEDSLLGGLVHTGRVDFSAQLQTRVLDIMQSGSGFVVMLADGRHLDCDAVVIATGNPLPADPLTASLAPHSPRYRRNPWEQRDVASMGADDRVLLIGTGLTMVDVALALDAGGHRGAIDAISRRGLLPRAHTDRKEHLPPHLHVRLVEGLASWTLREVLGAVRGSIDDAAQRGYSWHAVFDVLRPLTPALWSAMSAPDRERFVKWLRPFWEVHRHRMAPAPAATITAMQAEGRLSIRAGRITRAFTQGDSIVVEQRLRGESARRQECYSWIVNCTGPAFDRASSRVLERHLIDRGMLRQDPLGLGYVTGHNGAAFGIRGPVAGLYLLGPACRPERWENTAVPELRQQADLLATELIRMSSASTSQRARQPGTAGKASSPSRVDSSPSGSSPLQAARTPEAVRCPGPASREPWCRTGTRSPRVYGRGLRAS